MRGTVEFRPATDAPHALKKTAQDSKLVTDAY